MSEKELFGFSKEEAERLLGELKKYKTAEVVKVERKLHRRFSPPLHSLTSLQREANQLYGFSAEKTLKVAQKLYETRKVISYPRTESRYLATSNKKLVVEILRKLGREELVSEVEKVGKRVFDDSKLTDHHAIIPLEPPPADLTEDERKIYDLVLKRFLAVFYPPHVYETVKVLTRVGKKFLFFSHFKRDIELGWRVLYSKNPKGGEIPELREGDVVEKVSQRVEREKTQPPPRYTEGALLKVMEKLGLGTPATRAQIIETLKKRGYVTRKGKVLIPTEKGKELIGKLEGLSVVSPELTAEWEKKLEEINLKKLGFEGYKTFLEGIKRFTAEGVEVLKKKTFEVSENFSTPRVARRGFRKRRR